MFSQICSHIPIHKLFVFMWGNDYSGAWISWFLSLNGNGLPLVNSFCCLILIALLCLHISFFFVSLLHIFYLNLYSIPFSVYHNTHFLTFMNNRYIVPPMAFNKLSVLMVVAAIFCNSVSADPDLLQDVCVADLTSSMYLTKLVL